MTGRQLQREFAPRGRSIGASIVFDEHVAMALIRRAQEEDVAIVGVEQLRPADFSRYTPPQPAILRHRERPSSWRQAAALIESLSARGLFFDVILESRWGTWLARLRWHMTHGPAG
jgi:hypothetical protein